MPQTYLGNTQITQPVFSVNRKKTLAVPLNKLADTKTLKQQLDSRYHNQFRALSHGLLVQRLGHARHHIGLADCLI